MRALVTGGGGFLGKAIVRQLCERGDQVIVVARNHYPEVEEWGAVSKKVDLVEPTGLTALLEGVDVVFHTAAKAGVWGPKEQFWKINVQGTQNILQAAQEAGVAKFVFTSSPSAVWHGGDECNLNEQDCPYPDTYLTHYPHSKATAEKLVLAANSSTFSSTALRPHLIWGPGDPHLVPRFLRRAHRLRIIGDGLNKVGLTYVENAAYAHLLAADKLSPDSANAGKAYFITDEQPVVLWEWLNALLVALERPIVSRRIGVSTAYRVGAIMEWVWRTFRLAGEPMITRFVAKQLAASHYYDLSAAQHDFGYHELVDPKQGWKEMCQYFKQWLADEGI